MINPKQVFWVACMGMLLFGMVIISLGAILPEITAQFQLTELDAGVLTSILPLGILAGSLLFGPIADGYGYKGLLTICSLLVMVGLESIAFASSYMVIQVGVFLIGAGGGALNGATNAVVADISEGERSAKLSSLGVFFGVGALGMPVLLASLSGIFTREQILAGVGASVLLVIIMILITQFPQSKQNRGFPIKEGWELLKNPIILLLGLILFFQSGLEGLINNWSTSFLQKELQLSVNQGLSGLTFHMASLTLMRIILGNLLKRVSPFTFMVIGLGLVFIGIFLFWTSDSYYQVIAALITVGFGFAGIFPIVLGRISDLWPKISGTAFSIVLVIGLFGNISINYLMGVFSYHYGIQQLPLAILICALLLTLIIWVNRKQFR